MALLSFLPFDPPFLYLVPRGNVSDSKTDFPLPSSPSLGSSSFFTWNLTDRFTLMGAFLLGYRAAGPLPTGRQ